MTGFCGDLKPGLSESLTKTVGDAVTAVCKVREVLGKRRVRFECQCPVRMQCKAGDTVVEGEALVLAPARP